MNKMDDNMKKSLFIVALAAIALLSCAKEQNDPQNQPVKPGMVRLQVTASSETTKTTLGEDVDGIRTISWVKNDAIKVIYGSQSTDYTIAYAANDGLTTTFTVDVPATTTTLYAVYPADAFESIENGAISVQVPAFQDGDFASANIAVARSSASNPSFAFKNVCGYVLTDISDESIHKVTLTAAGQTLSGTVPVSISESGELSFGEISNPSPSASAYFNTVGQQIIAVLPGLSFANGVSVAFGNADGDPITVSSLKKDFTLARGNVLNTGKMDESTTITYFATVSGAGSKNGSSWDNAWGVTELSAWLAGSDPTIPSGKTESAPFNIVLAAGTYTFPAGITVPAKGRDVNLTASGEVIFTCPESVTTTLLYFNGEGNFSFTGIQFSGHKGTGTNRVAVSSAKPSSGSQSLSFVRCTFANNTSTGVGAGLVINNCGVNFVRDCIFSGNKAGGAPALNIDNSTTVVTVSGCQFTNNVCTKYSTSQDSGAMKIGKGDVTVTGCTFSGNYVAADANGGGGAVWVDNNTSLPVLFQDCTFSGNSVKNANGRGGAIYLTRGTTTTFKDCTFSNNACTAESADSFGGAVCIGNFNNHGNYDITADFDGCTFSGNKVAGAGATTGYAVGAGGIYMAQADGKTTLCRVTNCSFRNHVLNNRSGAGIFAQSGTLTITGGEFSNNDTRRTYEGGTGSSANYAAGIEVVNAACTITGGTVFKDNWSGNGGAALFLPNGYTGTISIDGASFTGNQTAASGGGAIRIAQASGGKMTIRNATFSGNIAPTCGGAICNYQDTDLELIDCVFSQNKASSLGGAIYSGGEGDCANTVSVKGCTFTGNQGYNGGGAIEISNNQNSKNGDSYNTCRVNLLVEDSEFTNNFSAAYGGAIGSRTSGLLKVSGSTFEGNYTTVTTGTGCGGAISIKYGQTIALYPDLRGQAEISGCTFKNNHTGLGNGNSQARGGAIAFTGSTSGASYEDIRIYKCSFVGNYATQGGAILAHSTWDASNRIATLYLNDCSFDGNYIPYRTGTTMTCFYLTELGINNCSFRNSWGGSGQAATNLGWINMTSCNAVVSNCTLVGQPARQNNDNADYADGNLVRIETDKAGCTYNFINNLIASPKDWCKSLFRTENTNANTFNLYSNKLGTLSANLSAPVTDTFNGTDWLATTACFGGLAWTADSAQPYKSGWTWNGSLSTGTPTTMNTLADVKAKIEAANAGFHTWLGTVDGLDKDQRGNNRGTNTWPGALQN